MATTRAIALKRAGATTRIEVATATLAERFGIAVPSELLRPYSHDPALGKAQQLEAFADVLEQVLAADVSSDADTLRIAELEAENADLRDQLEKSNGKAEQGNAKGSPPEGKPKGKA